MDKVFEALENLFDLVTCQGSFEKAQKCYDILEEALNELKAIKETKPSEAMKCVDDLIFNFTVDEYVDRYDKNLVTIKNYIFNTQEQEKKNAEYKKVLEIIEKKGLPLGEIKMIKQSENYEKYVIDFSWANFKNISIQKTQEEFELLKHYFGKIIQKQ